MEDETALNQINITVPVQDELTKTNVGSSFRFESGITLSKDSETVYFVLEPNSDSEKLYSDDIDKDTLLHTENLQCQTSFAQAVHHSSGI